MSTRVLLVDDDENVLAAHRRSLRKRFVVDLASSGLHALRKLESEGPYAVTVADMQMPGMNGLEFLRQAEITAPEVVRIMLTGNADQKTAIDAVNHGHVFRFLTKPCDPETLSLTLESGLRQHQLIIAERELLENTLNGAVKILMDVLSAVDPHAFGRGRQLRDRMHSLLMSFTVASAWEMELAAMLSPIGHVTLPPTVLLKYRSGLQLTAEERDMLQRVPQIGSDLLEKIPRLENIARIVRFQNKNFDGTGFPARAPGGDQIPIGARILKVLADLLELQGRSISTAAALLQMHQNSGKYDPQVLNAVGRDLDIALPSVAISLESPLSLNIKDLQVGQFLAEDLKTDDGLIVVLAGTTLSPVLLERLRNFRSLGTIPNTVLVCPARSVKN